jgi:hypothetical protein
MNELNSKKLDKIINKYLVVIHMNGGAKDFFPLEESVYSDSIIFIREINKRKDNRFIVDNSFIIGSKKVAINYANLGKNDLIKAILEQ